MAQRRSTAERERRTAIPVAAGAKIGRYEIVCHDGNGLAVAGADAAGLTSSGVAVDGYDNTGGTNGTLGTHPQRYVTVDSGGRAWSFATTGTAPEHGEYAYVVDATTVSADPTTNNVQVGIFVEPDPATAGSWFVRPTSMSLGR
ncbi:MAG: hypothetical protein AAGN66_17875 [Acidobacteriota bacterium]